MKKLEFRYLITIIIIVIGISMIVFSFFIMFKSQNIYKYIKDDKNYNIEITCERAKIKELDKKIKETVEEEKQNFITQAEQDKENKEVKYQLLIKGKVNKYNNLYFYDLTISTFTKENHYNKNIIYNYDSINNKFITITDLLKDDKSFTNLSLITEHLVNIYAKNHKLKIEKKNIKEGTSPKEENYKKFYFDKNGLVIVFPPHQISSLLNKEIKILIPWSNVNELLKEEYISEIGLNREKRDISKYKNKKVIAFTFDDGPNTETTKILLDNLNKYDAKVTFFVVGSRVRDNKEILKRAYQEGNDIGSHTYSHKDLTTLKNKELLKEINKTNQRIREVIGVEPIYLRPPYGSINDNIRNSTIMHIICWNVDSLDWQTKDRKKIKKEILKHAGDGDIVLLHDIYKESVKGALLAMEELQKKGYSFVTITELAELKNVSLKYDKTYYGF